MAMGLDMVLNTNRSINQSINQSIYPKGIISSTDLMA